MRVVILGIVKPRPSKCGFRGSSLAGGPAPLHTHQRAPTRRLRMVMQVTSAPLFEVSRGVLCSISKYIQPNSKSAVALSINSDTLSGVLFTRAIGLLLGRLPIRRRTRQRTRNGAVRRA